MGSTTLSFAFKNISLPVPSTSLQSEHSPSGVYSFGAHCGRLPPSSSDFGYSMPRRQGSSPPRPSSSTLPSVSTMNTLDLVSFIFKQKEVQAGPSAGYPVSRYSITSGSGERLTLGIQGSGDCSTCVPHILPTSIVISTSVPVLGFTQLGFRSNPYGIIQIIYNRIEVS